MARNDPVEAALERLASVRRMPDTAEAVDELRNGLRAKSNFVVARAAKIVGELRVHALLPELTSAFVHCMTDPAKLDKGCAAVTEIVSSLYELDYTEPDVYLRAIHHVQLEGSFGPPVDVAAKLRGIAALGLIRSRYPKAMEEVVNLLADKQVPARLGAVRALSSNGGDSGVLLLRLKVLTGDEDPEVLGECFAGLLSQSFDTIPFVAHYADHDDAAVAEGAILALGSSRRPDALAILKEKWERTVHGPLRKTILTAMSMNRTDDAADFLLSLLASQHVVTAKDVLMALAAYRSSERIRDRIDQILTRRGDETLLASFRRDF